jgi:hypothetical protein
MTRFERMVETVRRDSSTAQGMVPRSPAVPGGVGDLGGEIGALCDRDTDPRGGHGRGVVHPVADEQYRAAALTGATHFAKFVVG